MIIFSQILSNMKFFFFFFFIKYSNIMLKYYNSLSYFKIK